MEQTILSTHAKISKKKKKLQPTKKILLTVTDHAPDVICRFDKLYRLLYVNPAIEKATGIPTTAFINRTTRELGMPEEHSQDWENGVLFVFQTGQQTTIEFPFLTPQGIRHYHSLLVPEFNDDGEIETVLSISRDITEMKDLEKQKQEMVGVVSHELKSPVTSLKIFTQTLQQKFVRDGDMSTARHLERMDMQIDRLKNIISDLTEATRIQNNSFKIQTTNFDFMQLVKEIVEEVQKTTTKHLIRIRGTIKQNVTGDTFRIAQVLTNLLTNAIKYSPHPSEILVTVVSDMTSITCSVKDSGIGIAPEEMEKVFDRFYRVNDSQEKANLGLGLGLYISQEIIKNHGGKMWVKSRKGKGSTFYFTLPIV